MKNRQLKQKVDLLEFISFKKLRTVEDLDGAHALKEYPITFHLKDPFRKTLSFKTLFHGRIYAFAFITDAFDKFLKEKGFDYKDIMVDIADWDSVFVLSIEDNKHEAQYFVLSTDVKYLLENCLRIPDQRELNDMN